MFANNTEFKEDSVDSYPELGSFYKNTAYESISKAFISKIQHKQGILLLVGATGTGKTFLLHEIESDLGSQFKFVYPKVRSRPASFDDIIDSLCDELKLERSNLDFLDKVLLLNKFLHTAKSTNIHTVLIIDDAHELEPHTLESLLLVATPRAKGQAVFQLLFSGLPELEHTMHQLKSNESKQHNLFCYRLEPGKESIEESIEDRPFSDAEILEKEVSFRIKSPSKSKKRLKIRVAIPSRLFQLENLYKRKRFGKENIEKPIEDHPFPNAETLEKKASFQIKTPLKSEKRLKIRVAIPSRLFRLENLYKRLGDTTEKATEHQDKIHLRLRMGWKLILALAALLIIYGSIFLKRPAVIAISPDAIIASVVNFSNKAAIATTSFISNTLPDTIPPSDPSADLLPQNPHARDDHEGVGNLNQSKGTTSQVLNHAGNIARKFIHKQENSKDPIDLELIYRKAEILSQQKRVTDAYLLYFYAAKSGNGNAAFQLARLADPATFKPHLSMMDAPDPIQANKWYLEAVRNGYPDANYKIEQFYFRLAAKATDGDEKTQRIILLLQE